MKTYRFHHGCAPHRGCGSLFGKVKAKLLPTSVAEMVGLGRVRHTLCQLLTGICKARFQKKSLVLMFSGFMPNYFRQPRFRIMCILCMFTLLHVYMYLYIYIYIFVCT